MCLFSHDLTLAGLLFRLLPLVVMPLDGEEHAGAKHGHLEDNEDYRDPIHFLNFSWLLIGTHYRKVHCLKTLRQQLHRVQAIVESHIDSTGQMI